MSHDNKMPIIRLEVIDTNKTKLDSVYDISKISKMCLEELCYKPMMGLGVCYKNDDTKHFFVDVEVVPMQYSELLNGKQHKGFVFKVINPEINLMHGSCHSMCEAYYGTNRADLRYADYSFYGNTSGFNYVRDEYFNTVSYNELYRLKLGTNTLDWLCKF